MTQTASDAELLHETLLLGISKTLALKLTPYSRRLLEFIFGKAIRYGTQIILGLDRAIGAEGLAAGARWLLPYFTKSHSARGAEYIPASGPFIIAANHPGSIDAVVIAAHSTRDDIKFIIGDVDFLRHMPNARKQFLFAPRKSDASGRMWIVRESLRHLQNGGGMILFPLGDIEPDPEFMPHADSEFHRWSRSLEVFLKRVPDLKVVVTIVSGVIAPSAMKNPFTRFRKSRANRQRLAFIYQVTRQILRGKQLYDLAPRATFGEIVQGTDHADMLADIEHAAQRVLAQHLEWQADEA